MSEINKNTTITGQYYSTSRGPLDAKLTPAETFEELSDVNRIPISNRYVGLTVTVLKPTPVEYWLVGGRTNNSWRIKAGNIIDTKANLLAISPSVCTVGLEMVVQNDETNDNKLTKYWVTSVSDDGVVWEQKRYGEGGSDVTISGEDIEN